MAGPEIPEAALYVWKWFQQIHGGRTLNVMGETKATHLDIFAWQSNNRINLEPWERDAVQALGSVWLAESNTKKADGELPPSMRKPHG